MRSTSSRFRLPAGFLCLVRSQRCTCSSPEALFDLIRSMSVAPRAWEDVVASAEGEPGQLRRCGHPFADKARRSQPLYIVYNEPHHDVCYPVNASALSPLHKNLTKARDGQHSRWSTRRQPRKAILLCGIHRPPKPQYNETMARAVATCNVVTSTKVVLIGNVRPMQASRSDAAHIMSASSSRTITCDESCVILLRQRWR
jgi:hypothetical protein